MASNGTATAKIQMLDDTTHTYDVKVNSYGVVLLQSVMKDLNVLEADYFGILFKDKQGIESFLDPLKKIKTQIQNINSNVLKFVVRFFPPDPGQLQEEYTRYLFALQVKRDIAEGLLPCNENTLAIMTAYIAQSSFGDWNYTACYNLTYLRDMKLLPLKPELNQEEMLSKIAGQHKLWSGQTSADADYHLLDVVRKLELYGIRLHPAHDQEKTEISLAVAHAGVMVFRGYAKINTFNWARIRKLSFKKKRFLIKLKTDANLNNPGRNVGDVLIFIMTSRDACKSFWRHCIEYHAFFRLEIRPNPKPKPLLLSRGSTFRYSGKTQKQLSELVRTSNFRRTMFVRASSRKPAAHSPRTSSWTPNAARKVPPPTLPSSVANGFKAEAVVENHDGITLSPIRSEVESNGQLANRYAHSSITSEEAQKNTLESRNGRPSSNTSDSWQVKSENLHSNVVVSRGMAEHQSDYEKADTTASQAEPSRQPPPATSSVPLHSGGTTYLTDSLSSGLDRDSRISASSSPSVAPSSIGAMLTKGLRSTSSFNSESKPLPSQDYYIAKEALTTERTFVKDLEVITKWFKAAIENQSGTGKYLIPDRIASQLFGGIGSLLSVHLRFLSELDNRLSSWYGRKGESNLVQRIDDIMLSHMLLLGKCLETLQNSGYLITALVELGTRDPRFESTYRDFELQKVCYLPFSSFLLMPMQRVAHYKIILENLVSHVNLQNHSDLEQALKEATLLTSYTRESLKKAHNLHKMAHLRRDLLGVDHLLETYRSFIREGSLYKLSRKGFQQRLFFLFSDCLLYTSKGVTSTNQFKVHAELPLQGMIIEINEGDSTVPNCFSILSGSKTVIVAAACKEEMDKWLEDISGAIAKAGREISKYESPLTNGGGGSLSRLSMAQSSEDGEGSVVNSMERIKVLAQQRSNTTMHVCWHRITSISASEHLLSLKNQLSGYLLRKFKNSNGWQKLWVVFANFCLFFYKSHQDDASLASLPLLGYTIGSPTEEDGIRKMFVFKLQFKTHLYFFRAESQYTYNRWMQVLNSATGGSQRTRLFSRLDSYY